MWLQPHSSSRLLTVNDCDFDEMYAGVPALIPGMYQLRGYTDLRMTFTLWPMRERLLDQRFAILDVYDRVD